MGSIIGDGLCVECGSDDSSETELCVFIDDDGIIEVSRK